ncbi:PDZ domain-containing protein, partial [Nguyenibacter vanlangensis]
VVVSDVQSGSPADQAGIRPGDVIQAVGNRPVENPGATVTAVRAALKANQSVLLRILRNGQNIFVAVTPGTDNDSDGGATGPGDDNN